MSEVSDVIHLGPGDYFTVGNYLYRVTSRHEVRLVAPDYPQPENVIILNNKIYTLNEKETRDDNY